MNFLPYGTGGAGSWAAATGGSAIAHAAVLALMLGGLQQLLAMAPQTQARTEFTITLERLDTDVLAGLVERTGLAGAESDTPSETDQPVPETAEAAEGEELAALAPEAASVAEPDTPEEAVPEEPETADPETVDESLTPEEVSPPEPEIAEAAQPEELVPETPDALSAEALEPEAVEPETLSPEAETLEPEVAEPALPAAETIQPGTATVAEALEADQLAALAPTAVDPGPLIPETVAPTGSVGVAPVTSVAPDPGAGATVAPVVPEQAQPDAAALTPITPSAPAAQAIRPSAPPAQVVTAAPRAAQSVTALNRPAPPAPKPAAAAPPAPPPSAQDLAIGDLIQRIRGAVADPCLLALPRRDGDDGVGLALIASEDAAMTEFADTVLTSEDADIRQTRTLVDPRQCPALTWVRQNRDYPAARLGLRIDTPEVPSGGRLTGVLRGTGGRYVTLLLVDNNGVVQDLQRFMTFSGNYARFDVPVTRAGPPRDTSQLLIAIATKRPANTIRARAGQLAQDVFAGLEGESATAAALALSEFDVR